jgi:hypothetical protein
MRTFTMYRRNREAVSAAHESDAYSVDGDEPTLEGVEFTDGTVAIRWLTPTRSTVVWSSLADFQAVHVESHPSYGTEIVWANKHQEGD